VLFAYFWILYKGGWHWGMRLEKSDVLFQNPQHLHAITMVFAGIVIMQIANIFACRSETKSAFRIGFFNNKLIVAGIIFELIFTICLIYLPFFQRIFNTSALSATDWILLILLMLFVFFAEEGRKWFNRKRLQRKAQQSV
jgi:magnesium-transporting ATPase (P-type)